MSNLSERAMLVQLHISSWSGMMVDRDVTDATNSDFKAEKDAGRYNKRLVAAKFMEGISSAHSKARNTHRILTLPWEDNGARALASVGFIAYRSAMDECKLRAAKEVKAFLETRDAYIADAQRRLGDMYNIDDYPSADDIKAKFAFDVEIKPMPEAGDFRAKLSDESVKAVVKDIERRSQERLEVAMKDVFKRISEMVERMSSRLRDYQPPKGGNKAEGIIRDSLVSNIYELANDVLPALNITNDKRIDELRASLLNDLVEHSPEILRADAKVRQATISKADKILKKVKSYMV